MNRSTIFLAMFGFLFVDWIYPPAFSAQTESKETEPSLILTQLQSNTVISIKIETSKIEIVSSLKDSAQSTDALNFLQQNLALLKSNVDEKPVYGMVDLPYSFGQPHLRMWVEKTPQAEQFITSFASGFDGTSVTTATGYLKLAIGNQWLQQVPYYRARADHNRGGLPTPGNLPIPVDRWSKALEQIKDYPIQIAIVPPDHLWKTYEETMTELPDELGGGAVTRLTQGLKFMAIGIDLKAMTLSTIVQSSSPAAAEQFAELLPELLPKIVLNLPQPYQKACQAILDAYRPRMQTEIKGDQILFSLKPDENRADAAAEFATLLEQVLPTLLAKEVKPRLRELAVGLHNYVSVYQSFPPAKQFRNSDGSSGLSWRVHILPFIEENELYQQFKLNEPWDSPHNLPLLKKMPDIYQTGSWKLPGKPNPVAEGHTTLVGPAGEGAMFGGKEALTYGKVVDGTSNTIMLVVVKDENAVPWTAPQDYSFDVANPVAGLAVDAGGNFMAAMGDGSVQEIRAELPTKTILNLFQMNDGNVVTWK